MNRCVCSTGKRACTGLKLVINTLIILMRSNYLPNDPNTLITPIDTHVCRSNLGLECLKNTSCAPIAVCPSDHADENVNVYKDSSWLEDEKLITVVEGPELAFMAWAESVFDNRLAAAAYEIQCQVIS